MRTIDRSAGLLLVLLAAAACESRPGAPTQNPPAWTTPPPANEPRPLEPPSPLPPEEQRRIREALLEELRPVALTNCTLKRYGSPYDGGYLMCANLLAAAEGVYSYGIDREDNWGCQVARQVKRPVHQYDCFTLHRPPCEGGIAVFHDECIGDAPETIEGEPFDTLANQIARNGYAGKRLLVKMDVEGAEWESIAATPDDVLARIDQLPMELHGVNDRRFIEVVRKLKRTFYLVNLHFNNWSCTPETAPLPARAYQVLWVNKRLGALDAAAPDPPPMSPENAPDNPRGPDCQLPR